MLDIEQAHIVRGLIQRGVVRSTNDKGQTQTATVTTHRHVDRADVEIAQPFGFASNPGKGGQMYVFAVGGDQGDLIGFPVANRSQRLGKLKPGEAALYGADGSRVHVKADGTVSIPAREGIKLEVGALQIEISKGGDSIVVRREGNRLVVRPGYVKMVAAGHHVVVSSGGVTVSVAPTVGPDPEPAI